MKSVQTIVEEWKASDSAASRAEHEVRVALDAFLQKSDQPPNAELIAAAKTLRAIANEKLTLAVNGLRTERESRTRNKGSEHPSGTAGNGRLVNA